jgi:hypothetical protein
MTLLNAKETDLAPSFACSVARCFTARAQPEDMARLLPQHAGDISLAMRPNPQYSLMGAPRCPRSGV